MAQSDSSSKKLTVEQSQINQLIAKLEKKYTKEFAVIPFDGLLVAMNKKAFAKTTAIDSLLYELTSFNGKSGTGLLQYMTPGSIIPLFPSEVNARGGDVEVTSGHRFMDKVFILSGAEHVDKTQQLIPHVHDYDKVVASMAKKVRDVDRDQEFNSFANSVGADLLDATSDDALTLEYVTDLFEKFFPEINQNERKDYILYVACHAKAAVEYVLNNLDILVNSGSNKEKINSLLVSPKTMCITIDNQRLCPEALTYCRMLVYRENEVMLKPKNVEMYYGTATYVSDPVLKRLNETLKKGMTFDAESCLKLPECKFLVSMMASVVMYEYPTPLQQFPLQQERSIEMLAERLRFTQKMYFKNTTLQKQSNMSNADQLSCASLGILKTTGISPESLRMYRSDTLDTEQKKSRWPITYQQHVKDNIKRLSTNTDIEKTSMEKDLWQLKEGMASSAFQLLTLINYRDHVFHADVFKNALELYEDFVRQNPQEDVDRPGNSLKEIKIKPLCSKNVFDGKLSVVQNLFARFHFNPVAFKRFFITNALYYLGNESPRMEETITNAPLPEYVEIINGKGYPTDASQYICEECGNVPFYEKNGKHCLCFLLLKVVAGLKGVKIENLTTLRSVYDDYVKNVRCNFAYNGKMTSYKTLHNITVSETQSSSGYFGKIQLKHTGKCSGFGLRKKMKNENVEADAVGSGKQSTGSDVKEQEKEAFSYLETRKMEWLVRNVKTEMRRFATLGNPYFDENGLMKENPLWSIQRLWLRSETDDETNGIEIADLRSFVSGTRDDPKETCRNAVLSCSEHVFPLLVSDQPVGSRKIEEPSFDCSSDTQKTKQNENSGWECEEEEDGDDRRESEAKKPKLDYRAIAAQRMEAFILSVLYKLTTTDQKLSIDLDQIHLQHRDMIAKWNEKPKKYRQLFKETLLKIVLGKHRTTTDPIDIHDQQSLVALVVKIYLERLPTFISNVHAAVAKTLGMTPEELDKDFSKIVHFTEKTKREFISWVDVHGTDTLNTRSTMLSLFEVIRHEIEARATSGASETQTLSKANANSILRNNSGPYCKTVAGNVNLHVPIITDGDNGMQLLSISDNAATSASVAFDMSLPVKMKVSLNVTPIDENKGKTSKSESGVMNVEYEDDYDYIENDRRFVPKPLLNEVNMSNTPIMADTPKPTHELYEILRDEYLSFSKVGQTQFADVTKNSSTIQILRDYILRRTNGKKVHKAQNLIMYAFFAMINRALVQITLMLKSTVSMLSNIIPGMSEMWELYYTSDRLMSDVLRMRALECAVHAVCERNPRLASALYLFALCSELYGPACMAKDSNMDLERDNHALNAIVAGSLRLFVGSDDCNKITRKADSRQVRLVPVVWTYMKGTDKPYVATVDVARCSSSEIILNLQMGSYTCSHLHNSSVFTSVRGGAPFTKIVDPIMNGVTKTQIIDGEYNDVLCRPLVFVNNKFVDRGRDSISTIVETYPLQVFIRHVLENPSLLPQLLTYYANFLSKSQEECTEDDLWEACMKAHGISSDDTDAELYKDVILQNVYDVRRTCSMQTVVQEDEEDAWSDSD